MSMVWNYAPVNTSVEYSFNETTERGRFLLKMVRDCNKEYGKNEE